MGCLRPGCGLLAPNELNKGGNTLAGVVKIRADVRSERMAGTAQPERALA